jgi:hypothetical protein
MLDPLRNGDGKKNRDLAPPPRAKFLHFRPSRSPAMQEHMAEVVYPMAEVVKPTLDPNRSQGELEKSQSQGDFAWGSDRIAHELAHKLDQFTWRPEDGVRKLLWTLGTDHSYESKSRNSISVTPKNLTGLCNRFGLACNDGQAHRRRFLHAHTHYLLPTPLPHARHPACLLIPLILYALPVRPSSAPHTPPRGGRRNKSSSATGCRATGAACTRCRHTCSTHSSTRHSLRVRRGGARSAALMPAARDSASRRARARPE